MVKGTGREVLIRTASRLEPEWLLEAFPEAIRDTETLVFNAASGRVERRSGLWFEELCLDETRRGADPLDPRTADCLAQAALAEGFTQETLERLLDRARFLAGQRPDLELPPREELRCERGAEGLPGLFDPEGTGFPGLGLGPAREPGP